MLCPRMRGTVRLSCSRIKVRKLGLTGILASPLCRATALVAGAKRAHSRLERNGRPLLVAMLAGRSQFKRGASTQNCADVRPSGSPPSLLREVGVPGQPFLDRQRLYAPQEPLQTLEVGFALSLDQRLTMPSSPIVPSGGNCRRIGGHILDTQNLEPGLTQHRFVRTGWHEEIEPDRAPCRELLLRNDPSQDHRVGKEHPPAWSQDAVPVAKNREAVRDVAHRVIREDGVKALVSEWQRPAGINDFEADSFRQTS